MSIKSDTDDLARQRLRKQALTIALAKLEGSPSAGGASGENSIENGTENSPLLELPPYNRATSPARIVDQEPAWMRNGKQWRPMTRYELEAVQGAAMDKKALDQYTAYCELVQKDIDLGNALEKARQKRQDREQRTGKRWLPGQGPHERPI